MASAIGISLISSILPPMAAKAMDIIREKEKPIVDNIEREISNLHSTLRVIESIVHVAEEKQIDNVNIRNWLRDLVDIAYEARDVLENFITFSSSIITAEEASKPVNTISSLELSYICVLSRDTSKLPLAVLNRLAKDIRSVRERFDEKKEGETFRDLRSVAGGGGSENVREDHIPIVGPSINKQRDGLFLGREDVKQGIMEKILHPGDDNRVDVVAIWGMEGIGKTTLGQFIYNDERIKKVPRIWFCVGKNKFSAEKVMKEILNEKETIGIRNLQIRLKKKLQGYRFLIVLDDVWDVDGSEWDLLFNPLTEVGKGGLIIITKRDREVCLELIKIQMAYNLKPLSEEDSWTIFESYAYVNGKADSTPDLKCIGKEIVKKLNGLPLALKVVGRSLLNKDSSIWTKFVESNESMLRDNNDVMSALRWSYNHLPRHLKTCFTYCALFPKDHVLDKKVLVEMWMAHDLIQKEEQERLEDVGAQYFEELVNASLLQCSGGKYVMHDLIHDLALHVSNGEFAIADDSLPIGQMKKVRHVTIKRVDYSKIPRLCKIEKLLTLYTTSSDENYTQRRGVLDSVFKQMKSIRVLVLVSSKITDIPDSISELKHLRYLDVTRTRVKSLPSSLCHLYNLQMLAAPNVVLPNDVVKMVNLRYIRAILSTCKGVGKLTSLQELSSISVCRGDNIRELGDMQILHGKLIIEGLENVEKLEDDVAALMEKHILMDELELVFNKYSAKSTISAQVLDALGCPPNLKYLQIYGYTGVKSPSWMVDGKHKFDKLQTLELSDCPKLESLPPLGELTSLKHLSLRNVGVKRLGDEFYGKFTDGKDFFSCLESLAFDNMEELKEWDDIIIENFGVSFFPRLTTLEICGCPKLLSILPAVQITEANNCWKFRSLKSVSISQCKDLKSLPVDFHKLSSLKSLHINSCPQFQSLPPNFHKLSSLKELHILSYPQLKSLSPDFHKLSSLKTLYINDCPQLQSLPLVFHKLFSLEELYILSCPQLQSLPADGFPPSIRHLSIIGCLLLYKTCKDKSGLDWHKINHIPNKDIRP